MVFAFAVYSQDQLRINGATHSSIRGTHRAHVATRYRQRPEDSAISAASPIRMANSEHRSSERLAFVRDPATSGPVSPDPSGRGLILRA